MSFARLSRRASVPAWATVVGLAVLACSSTSARPGELGDCVKTTDAACATPDPGGGGGSGPGGGDSGAGDGGTVTDAVTSCGSAQSLLATQNMSCVPCIEGTSGAGNGCCVADQSCSGSTDCLNLLQCMVSTCSLTDVTCANNCESTYPNGVQAYLGFAQCLSQNCSPQCPTLPQGGTGDF